VLNNFAGINGGRGVTGPQQPRKKLYRRLAKFNLTTGLISITGNLVLMSILVGRFVWPVAGANVVTVAGCSIVSFFLADRIAFNLDERSTRNAN